MSLVREMWVSSAAQAAKDEMLKTQTKENTEDDLKQTVKQVQMFP